MFVWCLCVCIYCRVEFCSQIWNRQKWTICGKFTSCKRSEVVSYHCSLRYIPSPLSIHYYRCNQRNHAWVKCTREYSKKAGSIYRMQLVRWVLLIEVLRYIYGWYIYMVINLNTTGKKQQLKHYFTEGSGQWPLYVFSESSSITITTKVYWLEIMILIHNGNYMTITVTELGFLQKKMKSRDNLFSGYHCSWFFQCVNIWYSWCHKTKSFIRNGNSIMDVSNFYKSTAHIE